MARLGATALFEGGGEHALDVVFGGDVARDGERANATEGLELVGRLG